MLFGKKVKLVGGVVVGVVLFVLFTIELGSIHNNHHVMEKSEQVEISEQQSKEDIRNVVSSKSNLVDDDDDGVWDDDGDDADMIAPPAPTPAPSAPSTTKKPPLKFCGENNAPLTKIKYIKTHKTGSSTLTNIFHRFGESHNLNMALPRDNLYYAWPSGSADDINHSVEHVGNKHFPYDIMASGHVVYVKEGMDSVVPGGTYVTILRNPFTHFTSSWHYWHVFDHIKQNGGPMLSVYEFLDDVDAYKQYLSMSDNLLLFNNMASDLGLKSPTVESTKQLIDDMDINFGMVLITEYLMESLVLMKRRFCWTTEDILHMSLKVSQEHKKASIADHPSLKKLEEINFADLMIYRHFNASFWKAVEEEKKSGFDEEVAQLKAMIPSVSEKCQQFINFDEDAHRVQLEENEELTVENRRCHLMMLDSKGFVKHLKKRDGYPIEKLECYSASFNLKFMHLVMDNPADEQISNIFTLNPRLGRSMTYEDLSEDLGDIHDGLLTRPPQMVHSPSPVRSLSVRGLTYDRPFMDNFAPSMLYISTFRDPIQEFFDAWVKLKVEEKIKAADASVENAFDAYLDNPKKWYTTLSTENFNLERHLTNRIGYRMGVPLNPTAEQVDHAMTHIWWFNHISIAEYPIESLVMLRRTMCWDMEDIIKVDLDIWKTATKYNIADFTKREAGIVKKQLLEINFVDFELHRRARDVLLVKMKNQVSFKEEMEIFKQRREAFLNSCDSKNSCELLTRSRKDALKSIEPANPLKPFHPPNQLLDIDQPRKENIN